MKNITLIDNIINAYDLEIFNGTFLLNKRWKRKTYNPIIYTYFILSIVFLFGFISNRMTPFVIGLELLGLIFMIAFSLYYVLNKHYKGQLKNLGYNPEGSLMKLWVDDIEYHRCKVNQTDDLFKRKFNIDIDTLKLEDLNFLIRSFQKKSLEIKKESPV